VLNKEGFSRAFVELYMKKIILPALVLQGCGDARASDPGISISIMQLNQKDSTT
jgi:hypothetical protein